MIIVCYKRIINNLKYIYLSLLDFIWLTITFTCYKQNKVQKFHVHSDITCHHLK